MRSNELTWDAEQLWRTYMTLTDLEAVFRSLKGEGIKVPQTLVRVGNRDAYGQDFRWVDEAQIRAQTEPAEAVLLERLEWGEMYGYIGGVYEGEQQLAGGAPHIHGERLADLQHGHGNGHVFHSITSTGTRLAKAHINS